jgi:hypothetical protein
MRSLHDSLVLLSESEAGSTGYRVFPRTGALYGVRLWGQLHPQWAHRFTLGLSNLAISILNGFARQNASGCWAAEFLVTPTPGATDPMTVDFLSLTRESPPDHAAPLVIDDYSLDGSPERGAVLDLEVRGPDRVGFLGSLLRTLDELSLAPQTMTIVTRTGEASDRFALKTLAGKVPTDEMRRALDAVLAKRRGQVPARS